MHHQLPTLPTDSHFNSLPPTNLKQRSSTAIMLSTISLVALLTASASAAAVPTTSAPWLWHLTGATSVCTAATCHYSFDVSAPVGPAGEPSFTATGCYGTSVQGDYKSCATVGMDVPGDVLAQEFNHGIDIGAALSVRYTFEK
jgi:hypothetical protein